MIKEESPAPSNPVEHPAHYTQGRIEVLDFIEDQQFNFCEGCVVKYISRYKFKGARLEDLEQTRVYLDRLIRAETAKKAAPANPANGGTA